MDFKDLGVRERIERETRDNINQWFSDNRPNRYSTRISPSGLGDECVAELWYKWRWAVEPKPADGRMARYNSRGDKNEADVIAWLRGTGWTVRDIDPETGRQYAVSDLNGHLYGELDGIASHPTLTNGIEILLEFKYVNYKRFAGLTTKALIEADIKYYSQVCTYMYYRDLPACMFIPASRNDEDFKPIIIPRDDTQVALLLDKAKTIMHSKTRPARIAESPAFFKCKFCDMAGVCHHNQPVAINCRSCLHCVPAENGKFACERWGAVIPNKEAVLKACPQHNPVK